MFNTATGSSDTLIVAIAFLSGLIPALFWLWFWMRQDSENPESFSMLAAAFVSGMAIVPLVLPLQQLAATLFAKQDAVFVWVFIEEALKYGAALTFILWNKAVDEPIDLIIYMVTVALGFAALENALFIFNPLMSGNLAQSLLTGNFRFLGATLLHVLASGTIGAFLAMAYYKPKNIKLVYGTIGLSLAVVLHGLYNFFIMGRRGVVVLAVFLFVWLGIIVLLLMLEKARLLKTRHASTHNT